MCSKWGALKVPFSPELAGPKRPLVLRVGCCFTHRVTSGLEDHSHRLMLIPVPMGITSHALKQSGHEETTRTPNLPQPFPGEKQHIQRLKEAKSTLSKRNLTLPCLIHPEEQFHVYSLMTFEF